MSAKTRGSAPARARSISHERSRASRPRMRSSVCAGARRSDCASSGSLRTRRRKFSSARFTGVDRPAPCTSRRRKHSSSCIRLPPLTQSPSACRRECRSRPSLSRDRPPKFESRYCSQSSGHTAGARRAPAQTRDEVRGLRARDRGLLIEAVRSGVLPRVPVPYEVGFPPYTRTPSVRRGEDTAIARGADRFARASESRQPPDGSPWLQHGPLEGRVPDERARNSTRCVRHR